MTATAATTSRLTTPARAGILLRWLPRAALAAVIGGGGAAKLGGDPQMVAMFADIGVGQWLRYLVGALEVAGGVGLLVPRLAALAALGIAALMVGATVTNVVVLDTSPVITLGILAVAAVIVWARRDRLVPWA